MKAGGPDIFAPGESFRGYAIEKPLGKGGVGAVYLVRHELLDTLYALKVLYPDVAERDRDYVKRFLREAKLASRVRHPNLVSVHDCGFDEERSVYYLVMDYVDGGSLRNALAFAGRFEPVKAARIVREVAGALEAAQRFHVVHRDIKPENIMLRPDGSAKLVDLGIAKSDGLGDSLVTRPATVFGTPVYIAPEQALDSSSVDSGADIYSLGIVFFEMVAGRPPYRTRSMAETLREVLSDAPTPDVRSVEPSVPEPVAALIARMCEKERQRRLADYTELISELDRIAPAEADDARVAETEYTAVAEAESSPLAMPLEELPPENPTLSFETEDREISEFVEKLKSRKRRGFLARLFGGGR